LAIGTERIHDVSPIPVREIKYDLSGLWNIDGGRRLWRDIG
jgi:hypothetical protein